LRRKELDDNRTFRRRRDLRAKRGERANKDQLPWSHVGPPVLFVDRIAVQANALPAGSYTFS
jgi:hypothetical protein